MLHLEKFIRTNFSLEEPHEVEIVANYFKYSQVKKGDCIVEMGKRCDVLVFIQSGYFRIHALADGKEITQWISREGTFTTELASFYFDAPARWSIEALVDAEVYAINKRDFQKLSNEIPTWNKIEKQFLVGCFATMENRIYNFISMSSKERYDAFYAENKELFNLIPLKYIASMLGMTPETLSRIRIAQNNSIS